MSIKSRNLFYSFHIDGFFLSNTVWMIQSYFCGHNFKTVLSVSKVCIFIISNSEEPPESLIWHARIQKVLSEGSNQDKVLFCFVF